MWCSCLSSNELLQVSNAVLRAEVCGLRHYNKDINSRHWKLSREPPLKCLVAKDIAFNTELDLTMKQYRAHHRGNWYFVYSILGLTTKYKTNYMSDRKPQWKASRFLWKDTCTWLGPSCPDDRCKSPRSFSVSIAWRLLMKRQVSKLASKVNGRRDSE